jgi:S-formylglutathione hydrolase FrmB
MHKELKCVVIKPSFYTKKKLRFPVVYLLHGYGGWYSNWIIRVPELIKYADEFNLLIVCPEGGNASWYFDSPVDPNMKYESFISREVPHYIDSAYRTIAVKNYRAITGLSMGGHGALFIAWKHPDVFSAAGSMSGVVDLSEVKNKYEINKLIGDTLHFSDNWEKYSVLNVVETKLTEPLALIIDDGINDAFIEGNRRLHQKLLLLKIAHDYIERPGNHNWEYWRYAVHFQLLFFKKFFTSNTVKQYQ